MLHKGQRKAYCWSEVEQSCFFFHGLHRGIPHCIPQRWHVGESTPFSEWFMNGYRPRCGSVGAGSLKGGRRLCIKGRSWKVQHQGRLTIFTSIALCGRHFKGTSSLKNLGPDFHVRQNLFASLSSFYVAQFLTLSCWVERMASFSAQKYLGLHVMLRAAFQIIFETQRLVSGLYFEVFFFFLMDCFVFRCGSKIAEPSGGRGSVLARCNRFGRISLPLTSCLYWLGRRTTHR